MMTRNLIAPIKFILIVIGVFITSIIYGQTNEDAKLYAIWSDTTKPETDRIAAYFKKFDVWRISADRTDTGKKWYVDADKAIALAKKLGKPGYLPLFYMVAEYNCTIVKKNIGCSECTALNKVIESAKIANDSKYPVFWAYLSLSDTCNIKAKEEDIIHEFNKIKSTLTETPGDITILRELHLSIGSHFKYQDKYPMALRHYLESLRISENKNLMDSLYLWGTLEMAGIHTTIANYKEAEKYLDINLPLARQFKDPEYIGVAYIHMSELKLKQKNKVEAQLYIDSAMYIMKNVKKCEDCYFVAKIINASIKNLTGNYTGALAEISEVQIHLITWQQKKPKLIWG
jgi:tetratricopeptide (TPR) repeat protein